MAFYLQASNKTDFMLHVANSFNNIDKTYNIRCMYNTRWGQLRYCEHNPESRY